MTKQYSIAEARDQFASLIRDTEHDQIHITRRGKPVAVILSIEEYERLQTKQTALDFWEVYEQWREAWAVDKWVEEEDIFDDVRGHSSGREVVTWE